MAQRLVETPDGKLAIWSNIIQDFTAYDMDDEEAVEELMAKEFTEYVARRKVQSARAEPNRWIEEMERYDDDEEGRKKQLAAVTEMGFTDWYAVWQVMVS